VDAQQLIDIHKQPSINEEYVETCVDNWDNIKVEHRLINSSFLYSIIPAIEKYDMVQRVWIAMNGLVRINLKGFDGYDRVSDISLHPNKGYFSIIRSLDEEVRICENAIISIILDEITRIQSYFPRKKLFEDFYDEEEE
jgi:hypothetical protein